MALSDEDKKQMRETMAEGIADGLALFRSRAEEELAKNPPKDDKPKKEGGEGGDGGGFDLAGFILGRK